MAASIFFSCSSVSSSVCFPVFASSPPSPDVSVGRSSSEESEEKSFGSSLPPTASLDFSSEEAFSDTVSDLFSSSEEFGDSSSPVCLEASRLLSPEVFLSFTGSASPLDSVSSVGDSSSSSSSPTDFPSPWDASFLSSSVEVSSPADFSSADFSSAGSSCGGSFCECFSCGSSTSGGSFSDCSSSDSSASDGSSSCDRSSSFSSGS